MKKNTLGILPKLKNFDGFTVKSSKEILYPPILDINPEFAAVFLTLKDLETYYQVLNDCFSSLSSEDNIYTVLKSSILSSNSNFNWFVAFIRKMEELLEIPEPCIIPFDLAPKLVRLDKIRFYPPMKITATKKVRFIKYKVKTTDPVDLYRIQYIGKNLDISEFRDGFPGWYLMHDTVVYEKYNEKTNVRVRIDFRNGEFRYFICGASDNWQEIMDVPLEMDHVVSALLFRQN